MTTFQQSGLKPEIIKAVEELGFQDMMPVQEEVIPAILEHDCDLVGLAQTGTGKTASFGLPLLNNMDEDIRQPQVIIMTPTRELCIQIAKDFDAFSKYMNHISVVPVYGGASIEKQIHDLKRGAHVIVATPGRLLDLIRRKSVNFKSIKTVVLDEADEMLNMGFREDIDTILALLPVNRRTLMFSATMSKEIALIASKFMNEPMEIVVGKRNVGAENVSHICYASSAHDRYLVLKRIIDFFPDMYALIFCRTREETKKVAEKLIKDGYNADSLHGDLSQSQRDMAMQKFRLKNTTLLVATDVAARGLDVNDLTHVLNYNLPDELEAYTHRSGRTGRAGKEGISICIVHSREFGKVRQIEKILNKKIEKRQIPGGKEVCEKQLFTFINKVEKTIADLGSIESFIPVINKKLAWMSKEELIERMVHLEFSRLLSYYEDAPDLNPSGGGKTGYSDTEGKRRSKEDFTRFFINYGELDGLEKPQLIGMIKDATGDRNVEIGRIDIMHKFSFFECRSEETGKILKAFDGKYNEGRRVVVDLAQPSGQRESSRFDRRESRVGRDGRERRSSKKFERKESPSKRMDKPAKKNENGRERNFYKKKSKSNPF